MPEQPVAAPAANVKVGSIVELMLEGDDEPMTIRVVDSAEDRHKFTDFTSITIDSPLGKALIGKQAGDTALYRIPSGATLQAVVQSVG